MPIALGLVGNLATNTVTVSDRWWPPAVWVAVCVLAVGAFLVERGRTREQVPPSDLDGLTEALARAVEEQWRYEEEQRRVHDPVAMGVSWHSAPDALADQWANICRVPAGATAPALAVAGRVEQVAEVYRRIPSGRLVVLGKAGAGKTVLAARLARDLLADRTAGQPLPVIVSVGSWNPATTSLEVWLAGQLLRDHPALAGAVRPGGPTRAAALVSERRVLPILDGFDEIDHGLHRAALSHLNTTPDLPMVITSRAPEYTAAVTETDVLTAAVVIELEDLTLSDLADYLPRTAAGHRTGIWDEVLTQLREQPHASGPAELSRVLSNPLMVFLARTLYSDTPGRNPIELLDNRRPATGDAIEHHLLGAFIPAVYRQLRPGAPRWRTDRAHHYLAYLANHLNRAGTRDLAWWQLRDTVARATRVRLIAALGFTVGLGLGGLFSEAIVEGLAQDLAFTLTFASAVALAFALAYGFPNRGPAPTHSHLQIHGWTRQIGGKLRTGLAEGMRFGLVLSLGGGVTLGLALWFGQGRTLGIGALGLGFLVGAMYSLAVGLIYGLVVGLTTAFEAPVNPRTVAGFSTLLTIDRRNALWRAFVGWLAFALAAGSPVALANLSSAGSVALAMGLGLGLTFGLVFGLLTRLMKSAWSQWLLLARIWLPLTGHLPWAVTAFLHDAHQRGILRQTGAVYQFRHARVQDHLTP
ncbi:NACHT domain-containing protein [Streptomyces maoxianensis]|uniref:NACHT domain-containing protein n=1 Tax=Streptomyces maoxianensis TaxID=1459942 RepID=A0ABV9GBV5_9ACTN